MCGFGQDAGLFTSVLGLTPRICLQTGVMVGISGLCDGTTLHHGGSTIGEASGDSEVGSSATKSFDTPEKRALLHSSLIPLSSSSVQTPPSFDPDIQRFRLVKLLGKGGFGEVYLAFDLCEMRFCAVKLSEISSTWSQNHRAFFVRHAVRESDVLKTLTSMTHHNHVVRLYDGFTLGDDCLVLVLEYCGGGDLFNYMRSCGGKLSESEVKGIVRQVCSALFHLHSNNIIHYDLKPANVLFDCNGIVKLTDFGLCKVIPNGASGIEATSRDAGTFFYLPPEVHTSSTLTPTVDTWSLGVMTYEMLMGTRPFGLGSVTQDHLRMSGMGAFVSDALEFSSNIGPDARQFIEGCLKFNPSERLSSEKCLAHTWLCETGKKKK
ncbi:hypothetical protein ADUPG1_013346 [Aduncisulcus paluster]|uniref:Protein kinase domain-containing protein n=1 Tax=Aduncisulcus paluster TaxID=2918883 RepID=A0ABQ5K2K4_9EUKA|nr:hypothetical protein ADUPG1_013346 [Aduncisulcus paluster]